MNILGIIPARYASTRFPAKALADIDGKSMVQRVYEQARKAASLREVVVATDHEAIYRHVESFGGRVVMTSPDHPSGTDRCFEAVQKTNLDYDFVINIQGDEPLVDPKLIDRLARELQRDRKLEMITAAHPFTDIAEAASPHQVKVVLGLNKNALYFSRAAIPFIRDTVETATYLRHQGIYGYTRDLLLRFVRWKPSPLERAESLEQLRALENGVTIRVVVTSGGSPGVDTPEDAAAVERQLVLRRRAAVPRKRSDAQ